jgi:hypothetical protein
MKYFQWLLILIVVIIAMNGCRSTKTIQTVITKKDTSVVIPVVDTKADSARFIREVFSTVQKNHIDFNTFSAKVKVDFEGSDGKKQDFNAFLRVKKDSAIWVSVIALLGIEALRVMITPDSVKLLNKPDKIAQLRSVEYLREVIKIPLSFKELQDLLIGNPIYLDSNITSYKKEEKTVSLVSIGKLFKHFLTVSNGDYIPQHSKLDDIDETRSRTANITYEDYDTKDGVRFSRFRRISVSEKTKLDITLQFKQFDFNGELSFPFNIPKNYKHQ